ncbi:MAG: hypothetical protein SFX72_15395 [Isosphaeraceae bacterium]|nr:hypothetical protein [Isosphaeraceae bacterium]
MPVFAAILVSVGLGAQGAAGGVIFSDDFNAGASPLWGNQVGNWNASGGVYGAGSPGNFPNAHSTLPFQLADFSVEVDVVGVADGGIWLRSVEAPGTSVGISGVLLVTGAGTTGGTGLYWHIVATGASYGASLNVVSGLFASGSSPRIRVEVVGDTYSAYVNGSTTPATTLVTSAFASGRVGLYDFSNQSFDDFELSAVPEPSTAIGALLGVGLLAARFLPARRTRV